MTRDLDIDDVVAHHPEAKAELAEMRDVGDPIKRIYRNRVPGEAEQPFGHAS